MADSSDLVQPSVVRNPADPTALIIFFRDRNAKHIFFASSTDEGVSWSTPVPTVLPNNNAGIEAYPLLHSGDGIILAFNPQTAGRDPLAVGQSCRCLPPSSNHSFSSLSAFVVIFSVSVSVSVSASASVCG